jgi:hypothetical protein
MSGCADAETKIEKSLRSPFLPNRRPKMVL